MSPSLRHRLPLEWRLPLAISTVLLLVLATVSWLALREVAHSAREAAFERLQGVAVQLAQRLGARETRDMERVRGAADSAILRHALKEPDESGGAAALAVLREVLERAASPAAVVELRDREGWRVLAAGADTTLIGAQPHEMLARATGRSPQQAGVDGFVVLGDRIAWPTVATVLDDDGAPLGYLVEWSYLNVTPEERDAGARVLGDDAVLLLGSPGGLWTDQVQPVSPPPEVVVAASRPVAYERPGVGRRLGVAASVPGTPWLLLVEFSETRVLVPAQLFLRRIAASAMLLFGLALAIMVLLVRRVTRPLRSITTAAQSLSNGDYSRRVRLQGDDEIARLGSTFDTMAERIEHTHEQLQDTIHELSNTREQFLHAQRMEATGRLAGGIAHDFNNLLTVILGEIELTAGLEMPAAARESLHHIQQAGERAAGLTHQLLAFSRRQLLETSVFDVNVLVRDLERMLERVIGEDVRLATRLAAERPLVRADRGQIEQVIVNLAINARDAMPRGGHLLIESATVTLDEDYASARSDATPGDYVTITVSDTGTGMSDEVATHLFEPFFTTKPRGKGTGLGLASSYGITRQIGGHITAYSEPGVGTTMRVYLPSADAETSTPPTRPAPARGGDETILLVEDETNVRDIVHRMLTRLGYSVLAAADGETALELVRDHTTHIDMLLTDVVLPGIGGRELADEVVALRPATKVLFMSGYTDDVILEHRLVAEEITLLPKPFTAVALAVKVRELLDD